MTSPSLSPTLPSCSLPENLPICVPTSVAKSVRSYSPVTGKVTGLPSVPAMPSWLRMVTEP